MKVSFFSSLFVVANLFLTQVSTLAAAPAQQVLKEIAMHVETVVAANETAVVIFDLDDTLFDSRHRKLKILHEFAGEAEFVAKYPEATTKLRGLEADAMHYDIHDTLAAAGIENAELQADLTSYWGARFFTNEYVTADALIEGGVAYVNDLKAKGAKIVYLTGRDAPRMGAGTELALRNAGLPLHANAHLILKPNAEVDDTDFKRTVFANIAAMGNVVAAFDNEPSNVNAFKEYFTTAKVVFLDTRHSKKPDRPAPGIAWIKDFKICGQGWF